MPTRLGHLKTSLPAGGERDSALVLAKGKVTLDRIPEVGLPCRGARAIQDR